MKSKGKRKRRVDPWLYVMCIPALVIVIIYHYVPFFGWSIAFQRYNPALGMFGSPWVGLQHFRNLFINPAFSNVMFNTIYISLQRIVFGFLAPLIVSILLNELTRERYKKLLQTTIYLPHFLSWIVLGGLFISLLHPGEGAVNQMLGWIGIGPVNFLGDAGIFPYVVVWTGIWQSFGFGTIVYMAALTAIDPSLYEAAAIDRANRFQRIWHITLPGLTPIMVLVGTLSVGGILFAGFDQIVNLYNPAVFSTGDVIDTFVFRVGLVGNQFDMATAVGIFRGIISLVLVSGTYYCAYKFADYRIF